jgi:undecaprenyl-diphosphatase
MVIEDFLGILLGIDRAVYLFIQETRPNPIFDFLMPIVGEPRSWLFPAAVGVCYSLIQNRRRGALLIGSAVLLVAITDGSATALKGLFLRPRPIQTGIETKVLIDRPASSSFPSNHAANSFAIASLVSVYYPPATAAAFAVAGLVGFSRIYLKSHYPLDVLSGGLLGIILALAVALATRSLRERSSGETPDRMAPWRSRFRLPSDL